MKRKILGLLFSAFAALAASGAGAQEAYPSKAVRIVVPFNAGGISDVVARTIALELADMWKQPVVVENTPGAGGITGVNVLARSRPDGYSLLLMNPAGLAILPSLFKNVPFDVSRDLSAVTLVAQSPYVIVVGAAVPADDIAGLIALAKKKPGALNYGSGGNGTVSHLAGVVFQDLTGITWAHVPYKGDSAVMPDLLGGRLDVVMMTLPTALPEVRNGKLKALAVTGASRVPELPQTPTVIESGVKGFEYAAWQGIFAPANTPQPLLRQLHDDIVKVLQKPNVQARLAQLGLKPAWNDTEVFQRSMVEDVKKWAGVVHKAGIRPE
jgi:tripartite-type tricarboxylate transporter receptor subunit TctC